VKGGDPATPGCPREVRVRWCVCDFQSWVLTLLARSWRNPGTVHWFPNVGLVKQSNTHSDFGNSRNKPAPKTSFTPLTHTAYTNSILLDSWSISRDNTTPLVSLCVHRNTLTIPLGSLCVHRDAPSDKPPIKIPPSTFHPHPGFYILHYKSYKRQHGSVCVLSRCGVQSTGIFVILWPTCVVLSRYASSLVA